MRHIYLTRFSLLAFSSLMIAPNLAAESTSSVETGGRIKGLISRFEALSKPQEVRTMAVRFKDMSDLLGKIRDTDTYVVIMGKDLRDLTKRLKIPPKMEYHPQEMSGVDLRQEINNLALTGLTIFKVDRVIGAALKPAPIPRAPTAATAPLQTKPAPTITTLKFNSMEDLKSQISPNKRYLVMKGKDFSSLGRIDIKQNFKYEEQELSGEELMHDIDMTHASGLTIYGVREVS
ncbi:MAG: hypothetical protein ACTHJ4_01210 [Candidatus Nucleicultricaceae bacterium]